MINAKLLTVLGVINLTQIKNWELVKGEPKKMNAVLIDSEYPSIADHFAFAFNTKRSHYIFNFSFNVLDRKCDLTKFEAAGKKVPVLGFKIQIKK